MRDPVGRFALLAVGILIGLRAAQVAHDYLALSSYYSISGAGMIVGLVVTVVAVAIVASVWVERRPGGTGGARLAALAGGMILGALLGWVVVGGS